MVLEVDARSRLQLIALIEDAILKDAGFASIEAGRVYSGES